MNIKDILTETPNYDHLNLDRQTLTIELSAEEQATVLHAYDQGIDTLNATQQQQLNVIIGKLKDRIHP